MAVKDYAEYRKELKDTYDQQESEYRYELAEAEKQKNQDTDSVLKERETAARRAYVKEQKQLKDVSEQAAEMGKTGGRELFEKRRIRAQYANEMASLKNDYSTKADKLESAFVNKKQNIESKISAKYAEYLEKLSKLAAEEEAAKQMADSSQNSSANKNDQNSGVNNGNSNTNTGNSGGNASANNGDASNTDNGSDKAKSPFYELTVGNTKILFANGARVSNSFVYDGSGRTLLSVSGKAMTLDEITAAVKAGTVQCIQLENGRVFYRSSVGTGASSSRDSMIEKKITENASGRLLVGLMKSDSFRTQAWKDVVGNK
jgi:hypothetical protein